MLAVAYTFLCNKAFDIYTAFIMDKVFCGQVHHLFADKDGHIHYKGSK
jgi:hypothetical protein